MEATFYDDLRPRSSPMKRPMTLDLEPGRVNSKKPRVASSLLTSPDLNMLKLGSPELEKLIMQHQAPPGPCMYPKVDEREQPYANRDFTDALSTLQPNMYQQPLSDMSMGMPPCSTAGLMDSYGYSNHHPQQHQQPHQQQQQQPLASINLNCSPLPFGFYEPLVSIKEEPQTVPCLGTPPQSPIDMDAQERLKLERKRLRNRIAASKCRRRKLERIARLEDKVTNLKNENTELTNHVTQLRQCICQLKEQVLSHVRSGCEMVMGSYAADISNM